MIEDTTRESHQYGPPERCTPGISDSRLPHTAAALTWTHARYYRRAPQCSSGRAKNLPLPGSDIYVFVNILALPEMYFRADSPGCTKQRVPLALLDLARGTFPAYILLREAVACCTHAGRAEDVSKWGERSSPAPRPSSTITSTSLPDFLAYDVPQWVVDNLPFPGSDIYIRPFCGSDKHNTFTVLALPLYQSGGPPLWTVHMKDAVRCRR